MPVLFANVQVSTARAHYSPTTQITSAPTTYLQAISGHIMPNPATAYQPLPESALKSPFLLKVESGTDMRDGDIILKIILLSDGITPWPGLNIATNSNETWCVAYAQESTPGPLSYRAIYIDRVRGGGPTY